jgi:hypothetical protein
MKTYPLIKLHARHEDVWRSGGIDPRCLLTSALDGNEWSAFRQGRFTPGQGTRGVHWIEGCVRLRAGLDAVAKRKKYIPCRELNPVCPALSLVTNKSTNWCILWLAKQHTMKTYDGVDVWLHPFLVSALDVGEWSASRLGRFTLGKWARGTLWLGDRVGFRAGVGAVAKRKEIPSLPLHGIKPRFSSP